MTGRVAELPLEWVDRLRPRSFGKVLLGEIATCRQVRCFLEIAMHCTAMGEDVLAEDILFKSLQQSSRALHRN